MQAGYKWAIRLYSITWILQVMVYVGESVFLVDLFHELYNAQGRPKDADYYNP